MTNPGANVYRSHIPPPQLLAPSLCLQCIAAVGQKRLMAVEIIILQGTTHSCMTVQSLAYRDANRAPPPVSTHVPKISCHGSQSDTPAVQDERNHLVSADNVAATESELAQMRKRLLSYQPGAHQSH
jgi:hypothetical protein